jgi:hypothetical protein
LAHNRFANSHVRYHKTHGHSTQQLHENGDGTFSIVNPETSTPYPGTLGMEKEKPFKCDVCGKRYKNLNGLKYVSLSKYLVWLEIDADSRNSAQATFANVRSRSQSPTPDTVVNNDAESGHVPRSSARPAQHQRRRNALGLRNKPTSMLIYALLSVNRACCKFLFSLVQFMLLYLATTRPDEATTSKAIGPGCLCPKT